jgi:hypothetical protein
MRPPTTSGDCPSLTATAPRKTKYCLLSIGFFAVLASNPLVGAQLSATYTFEPKTPLSPPSPALHALRLVFDTAALHVQTRTAS